MVLLVPIQFGEPARTYIYCLVAAAKLLPRSTTEIASQITISMTYHIFNSHSSTFAPYIVHHLFAPAPINTPPTISAVNTYINNRVIGLPTQ